MVEEKKAEREARPSQLAARSSTPNARQTATSSLGQPNIRKV